MVERLIDSCRQHGGALADAEQAIRGFDLLEHNAEFTRKAVAAKLLESGETVEVAEFLSGQAGRERALEPLSGKCRFEEIQRALHPNADDVGR